MGIFQKSINFWQEKVDQFETSNLTQQEFCRLNNLNVKTFNGWRQRLLDTKKKNNKSFVEINAFNFPIMNSSQSYFDLIIKDIIKIRVVKNFDTELLIQIIKALEEK